MCVKCAKLHQEEKTVCFQMTTKSYTSQPWMAGGLRRFPVLESHSCVLRTTSRKHFEWAFGYAFQSASFVSRKLREEVTASLAVANGISVDVSVLSELDRTCRLKEWLGQRAHPSPLEVLPLLYRHFRRSPNQMDTWDKAKQFWEMFHLAC